jgi:hypothetical protein
VPAAQAVLVGTAPLPPAAAAVGAAIAVPVWMPLMT